MAIFSMRDIEDLKRLPANKLSAAELRAIRKEVERLLKNGQHYQATMLYGTYFPWVER